MLLLLWGVVFYDIRGKESKWYLAFIFIYLTLFIGLRFKVGGDTYNYLSFFYNCPTIKDWSIVNTALFEPGFSLFCSIIKTFTENEYIFQIIHVLIINFLLFRVICRYTGYYYTTLLFSYLLFYLIFTTEIMREAISILIFLNSYHLIEEKRYFKYYICVFIAMTFHIGAIFLVIIPFFYKLRLDYKFFIYYLAALVLCLMLNKILIQVSQIEIFEKLDRYTSHTNVGYFWAGSRFIYLSLLPILILSYFKHIKVNIYFQNMICLMALISVLIWANPIVFARFANYFLPFYAIQLANLFIPVFRQNKCPQRKPISVVFIFLILLTYSSYYLHGQHYKRWVPYHAIFNEVEEAEREKFVEGNE